MFSTAPAKRVGKAAAQSGPAPAKPSSFLEEDLLADIVLDDDAGNILSFREPAPATVAKKADATRAGEPALREILATVSGEPDDPRDRLGRLEDRIRRQWAVLQDLVVEHADLKRELEASGPAMAGTAGPNARFDGSRTAGPSPSRFLRAG